MVGWRGRTVTRFVGLLGRGGGFLRGIGLGDRLGPVRWGGGRRLCWRGTLLYLMRRIFYHQYHPMLSRYQREAGDQREVEIPLELKQFPHERRLDSNLPPQYIKI